MKIILNSYHDPDKGMDWNEQTPIIERRIVGIMEEFSESVDYSIQETNFGVGADWPTIALDVATIAGVGFFAVPEAHKRVREALEEWQLISANIKKLIDWIGGKESIVAQPIELIFIAASEALLSLVKNDDAVFLKYEEILPAGSHEEISGLYDFRFESEGNEWKVLINGQKDIKAIAKV
ncbi:hypothetical protein EDC39_1012 [Geothermobacter ehrlichii]|uniref:Uncharacterized protein n=1 Tax=Geothermobacter ehrlichii TaxID=213224 RepID=A0A5D3WL70_9BACT|nr:hypothetical protein [Geothermobacter ehrlichii]TYO99842.1 hypothetical protein EDC39_1012 [Geothermobacter ehrlichii]